MFEKKKAYLIKWTRELSAPDYHETVVRDIDESYAVFRFLSYHNAKLENLEILEVKEIACIEPKLKDIIRYLIR